MNNQIQQVAIKKTSASGIADWNMMDLNKFMKIQSEQQLSMILDGCVKFYDSSGNIIPIKEAIISLGFYE